MEWLIQWVRDDSKVPTRAGRPARPRSPTPSANGQERPDHLPPADLARVKAYLAKCEPSVDGDHGHKRLFWVCRAVVRGFLVPCSDDGYGAAFDLVKSEFNPRCRGPWSDEEIRHKVEQALHVDFDKEWGWLLQGGEDLMTERGNGERLIRAHGDGLPRTPWVQFRCEDCRMGLVGAPLPVRYGGLEDAPGHLVRRTVCPVCGSRRIAFMTLHTWGKFLLRRQQAAELTADEPRSRGRSPRG